MTRLFRDQLFAAAEQAALPPEPFLDQATGLTRFGAEDTALLARVFELFGVTALDAGDGDIDRVMNTACTLSAEVALDVQGLDQVNGDMAALPQAAGWHDDYRAYISALWQGDREQIARSAAALGLAGGIPNGSMPLQDGPLG